MMVIGVGACMALLLQPDTCGGEPWRFTEFYENACHHYMIGDGTWAGGKYEMTTDVMKRLADGVAEYQDYLEKRRRMCDKKEK
jgi:hypothetical protein